MMADEPREGRKLPGATTSEDERNGGEPILIQIVDGQVELELTAAPAGQVRIAAMNRGEEACDTHLGRQDAPDSTVVHLREIRPGDSAESVVELRDGDDVVTGRELQGHALSLAMLIVQPQEGLPGSEEDGALPI